MMAASRRLKTSFDHYIGGGNSNPHLDKRIRVLDFLSGPERGDLLELVKSLSGPMPPDVGRPENKAEGLKNGCD
jgi:hypothetical protein